MMALVGIIDGEILSHYLFINAYGDPVRVNEECIVKIVQDGATPYCTKVNFQMWNEKFCYRLISRRAEVNWPS